MAETTIDYTQYYRVGMRIGLDIPLTNGQLFREWGTIIEMEDDFLQLRLSRDVLPQEMRIEIGTIFLLVTGKEGTGLCCRGIVVGDGNRRVIPLRLISEVLVYERREFYRLGAYLPMAYQPCRGMTSRGIREHWRDTRLFRAWQWSELNEAIPMMTPLTQDQRSRFEASRDELKVKFQPIAVNISGGGIRMKLSQNYNLGDLVALQFFIPFAKPNVIDIVAEVVWTASVLTSPGGQPLNYVAMRYYHVDDRDRENIIRFISLEQLQQLQELRGKLVGNHLPEEHAPAPDLSALRLRRLLVTIIALAVLAAVTVWLAPILRDYYAHQNNRNEIERTFEQGVKQYRQGSGKN